MERIMLVVCLTTLHCMRECVEISPPSNPNPNPNPTPKPTPNPNLLLLQTLVRIWWYALVIPPPFIHRGLALGYS